MGIFEVDLRVLWLPMAAAFGMMVASSPLLIPLLRRLRFGQMIREEGPKRHYQKAGTPTMGGLIILLAIMLTVLPFSSYVLWRSEHAIINSDLFFLLFATVGYGMLGFLDDYVKVVMRRSLGLTALQKLLGQLFIGLILFWVLWEVRAFAPGRHIFAVSLPGSHEMIHLDLLYLPFLLLIFLGSSNAVNLTDGLDGLLSGTAVSAYGAFAVIGLAQGNYTVTIFSVAVVGALLGFLTFNAHPARIFMGDTGSMALGGGIAALAVITGTELLLPLIGGVFVMEALSVILQVLSFRLRGKRIFRMSPLHHHFELMGWSEWRVVVTFWAVSLLLATAGVLIKVGSM